MRRTLVLLTLVALTGLTQGRADEKPPDAAPGGAPADSGEDPATESSTAGEVEVSKLVMAFDTPGHSGQIRQTAFTPDARRLVSVGMDRTAQIWDVRTGLRLRVLRLPSWASTVAMAPDGRTVVVGGGGYCPSPAEPVIDQVYLLNLDDGRILPLLGAGRFVKAVAFSADGDRAFGDEGGTCSVWTGLKNVWDRGPDGPGVPPRARFGSGTFPAPLLSPTPDGSLLALRTSDRKSVGFWDLTAPDKPVLKVTRSFKTEVLGLAWSPDGLRLATAHAHPTNGAMKEVRLWSPQGELLRSFTLGPVGGGHSYGLRRIAFRDKNELLAFAHKGDEQFVQGLNLTDGSVRDVCKHPNKGGHWDGDGTVSANGLYGAFATGPGATELVLFRAKGKGPLRILPADGAGDRNPQFKPRQLGWAVRGSAIAWNARNDAVPDTSLDLSKLERAEDLDPKALIRPVAERDGWEVGPSKPGPSGQRLLIRRDGKLVAKTPPDSHHIYTCRTYAASSRMEYHSQRDRA